MHNDSNLLPSIYNPSLDSLRGIAVLCVVAGHAGHYFFSQSDNPVPGGFLGVDIFFVLSGFLITGILLRDLQRGGRVDYRRFYINRFLRLIPALLGLLVLYALFVVAVGRADQFNTANVLAVLFYYFNWYIIQTLDVPEGLGHLWSLSIEEQFYIVWPVLLTLLVVRLRSTGLVVSVFILLIALVALTRNMLWHENYSWLVLYIRTDMRSDGLLTGGLLAFVVHRQCLPRIFPQLAGVFAALALFALTLLVAREDAFLYRGGLTLISLLSALMIISALEDGQAFYDCWPLRQLGKVSYGVYLWHFPVFTLIASAVPSLDAYLQTAIGLLLTLLICSASWHVIEKPCLRHKRHDRPRQ